MCYLPYKEILIWVTKLKDSRSSLRPLNSTHNCRSLDSDRNHLTISLIYWKIDDGWLLLNLCKIICISHGLAKDFSDLRLLKCWPKYHSVLYQWVGKLNSLLLASRDIVDQLLTQTSGKYMFIYFWNASIYISVLSLRDEG